MAASRGYPAVHVATVASGVARHLKKMLPNVQIIEIELENGMLSPSTKEQIKSDATILLAEPIPVISSIMQENSNLKWVQSTWAGVDGILRHLDSRKPVPNFVLTRSGGASFGKIMADYVLGYVTAHERHFFDMKEDQSRRMWTQSKHNVFRPLNELSIGILGVGDIGREVARCCKTMGMTVWGMVRNLPPEDKKCKYVDIYRTKEELPDLLQQCDHVCNVLPSTPDTIGLLSGDMLLNCQKKKSFIINVGRGNIMEEEDIVKAVRSGWISGAVLDVFDKEPLPKDSALWSLPTVHITPHISGSSLDKLVAADFQKNYDRYINDQPLSCVFQWTNQY